MSRPRVAVILPVCDEAGTIARTVRDFHEKAVRRIEGAELIVAEDGSRDGTREILLELRRRLPFRLVSEPERKGYARAFKDALALADAEVVLFSDADGQHDPEDLHELLARLEDHDVVGGCKSPRRDPLWRRLLSRGYNAAVNLLFGARFRDVNAGFKAFRREVVEDVLPRVTELKACAMSEFMIQAHLRGWRVLEVPVRHYPRAEGESIFSLRNAVPVALGLLAGLARIRRSIRRG